MRGRSLSFLGEVGFELTRKVVRGTSVGSKNGESTKRRRGMVFSAWTSLSRERNGAHNALKDHGEVLSKSRNLAVA